MDIKVDINVSAAELIEAINRLAGMFPQLNSEHEVIKEGTVKRNEGLQMMDEHNEEGLEGHKTSQHQSVKITLEEVKARIGEIMKGGKSEQVKTLVAEFGVKKLREVPAERYKELLEKAEKLV